MKIAKFSTLLAFFCLFNTSPLTAGTLMPATLPDLVEKIMPGVVNISSITVIKVRMPGWDDFFGGFWGLPQERAQTSLGTGFIINSAEGLVITNNHVVAEATEVIVTLSDKRKLRAKLLGRDPKMDLALLQLKDDRRKTPGDLTAVPLGDSGTVRIGEPVFAVGNPFGLQHTVTGGIISAKHRTVGMGPFDNFLQTDASINPGNSGGPLFNLKGEVIGINTMIFSKTGQSSGLGFAIPINEAKALLPDLKKYGRVPRPWLGIQAETVTPEIASYYGLATDQGVLAWNLVQGSPALKAGLERGDVILSINGTPVQNPTELERALGKLKPTEKASLKIQRGSRKRDLTVPLQDSPSRIDELPKGIL